MGGCKDGKLIEFLTVLTAGNLLNGKSELLPELAAAKWEMREHCLSQVNVEKDLNHASKKTHPFKKLLISQRSVTLWVIFRAKKRMQDKKTEAI